MTANSIKLRRFSPGNLALLVLAWVLIIAKCLAVPWAITHWSVPIQAAWVIVPTLIFAGVVTALVVFVRE